jgi:hypothetical protein
LGLPVALALLSSSACATTSAHTSIETPTDEPHEWVRFDHDTPGLTLWGGNAAYHVRALSERLAALSEPPAATSKPEEMREIEVDYVPLYEPVVARSAPLLKPQEAEVPAATPEGPETPMSAPEQSVAGGQ